MDEETTLTTPPDEHDDADDNDSGNFDDKSSSLHANVPKVQQQLKKEDKACDDTGVKLDKGKEEKEEDQTKLKGGENTEGDIKQIVGDEGGIKHTEGDRDVKEADTGDIRETDIDAVEKSLRVEKEVGVKCDERMAVERGRDADCEQQDVSHSAGNHENIGDEKRGRSNGDGNNSNNSGDGNNSNNSGDGNNSNNSGDGSKSGSGDGSSKSGSGDGSSNGTGDCSNGATGGGSGGSPNESYLNDSVEVLKDEYVYQLILDIQNPEKRDSSLQQLGKHREALPNLAPYLWYSFGTITIFLQEIISIYPRLYPPNLSPTRSHRVCNCLALLQCVASHPATKHLCLNANIPLYMYPFLNCMTRNNKSVEYLRLTALGVVGAFIKGEDPQVLKFLLKTEIVPLCLRIMEAGSELSRTVATFIVQRMLLHDDGLMYVCATPERFFAVACVLGNVLANPVERPSTRLLKHVIRCYLRLCSDSKARKAFRHCLPDSLRDPDSELLSEHCNKDPTIRKWIIQILNTIREEEDSTEGGGGGDKGFLPQEGDDNTQKPQNGEEGGGDQADGTADSVGGGASSSTTTASVQQ